MLNVLDLFSGIGGFSLGLESTGGFRTVAFCEIDAKARRVLSKHWPSVLQFDDVRLLSAVGLELCGVEPIDIICGGFPCQDISLAGKGAGLGGERSGLWFEFHRPITEIRPRYAIIENVSALRSRGLETVLRGLAEIGYDAEWHCIPASAVGAPHRRDRVWIVAYAAGERIGGETGNLCEAQWRPFGEMCGNIISTSEEPHNMANPARERVEGNRPDWQQEPLAYALKEVLVRCRAGSGAAQWSIEPDVGRVAHGVPGRVDRSKQLGNAVVPQIPGLIGEVVLLEEERKWVSQHI